jgi:PAS domain S-box-containing protein
MFTDRRFKAIWGVGDADLSRTEYVRSIHPDDRTPREAAHQLSIQTGHLDYQARIIWPDGMLRWVRITGTVIFDDQSRPLKLIGIAQDITDAVLAQKKIEESEKSIREVVAERTKELAEANRNLERSNQELSQFAHIASHDLQEPARKIATYAGLLEDLPGMDVRARNYLGKMVIASNRMQKLVRDVLSYSALSRQGPGYEPVDLHRIVEDVVSELDLLVEQKSAIIRLEALPTIDAIPLQMSQLFGNLLSNALKYAVADRPPIISVSCHTEGQNFHIGVSDNGIGFDQKYADQIFSIFKRLHRNDQYGGTGIGLAMCKRIIENHKGSIAAISVPGEGTTFHIVLPAHQ